MFTWSRHSAGLVAVAELAAFTHIAGVRKPLSVAVGTLFTAGTLRTAHCLFLVGVKGGTREANGCSPACLPPRVAALCFFVFCNPRHLPALHASPWASVLHLLLQSFRHTGLSPTALEQLSSIWDWEPPSEDAGASSAWHVLRTLARTTNK